MKKAVRPKHHARRRTEGVELIPSGLLIGGRRVPLLAGSVHYWRLEPASWRSALQAVRDLGLYLVDTYVPWGVHETLPGEYDFGEGDPQLDVVRFLRLAQELELSAIVRPGPHINAELTYFGLPERIVWDEACQARSPRGMAVVLPIVPVAFPVPSYASETFHAEVSQWFSAVGALLAPLRYPAGPIVLLQIDNEGAMYFRDGVYDQDYHPDAVAGFRRFLQERYRRVEVLRRAWGDPSLIFSKVMPPSRLEATTALDLVAHLDWAEHQEELLAQAFARMKKSLEAAGLSGVPTSHNLPLSEAVTPLDPARVGRVVDLLGLDYYHGATPPARAAIARRTSDLALRAERDGYCPFACELGAGFPPFFPPFSDEDNQFTALSALAYGLRGYNVYMAVERDRWIGAPFDAQGKRRASAEFWQRLSQALARTRFFELRRSAAVHLIVPRSFRRLARALHAFGPLSPALFHVLGGGVEQSCFEDDLGLGAPVLLETERFWFSLERELEHERVPLAVVAGDLTKAAVKRGRWTVVLCSGALEPEIARELGQAAKAGRAVSFGPYAPTRDSSFRPRRGIDVQSSAATDMPLIIAADGAREAVSRAIRVLELPQIAAEPDGVFVTLHEDPRGHPAVLFVINPTEHDVEARVAALGATLASDALRDDSWRAEGDRFELWIPRRTVRMLELGRP
jgi:beta-galactosidase